MSFKEKAREIKEHGAAERGNYNPKANSIPVRLYKFWAELRPEKAPKRENFCHYWRVVLIWAPLWGILAGLVWFIDKFLINKIALAAVIIGALFIAFSLGGVATAQILGMAAVLAYALATIAVGLILGGDNDKLSEFDSDDKKIIRFFPLAYPIFFLVAGTTRWWDNLGWDGRDKVKRRTGKTAIAILGLFIAGLLLAVLISSPMVFFIMLGVAALIIGFIIGMSFLSDYFKMRASKAREARLSDPNYDWDAYWEEREAPKKPSRFVKFVTSIGDFFNLVFQAVRVKKWKICPLVEIPTDRV